MNIGGTRLTTRLSTFTSGRAAGTFFANLLSGRHAVDEKEVMIDRDGRAVHVLLNYFRNSASFSQVRELCWRVCVTWLHRVAVACLRLYVL